MGKSKDRKDSIVFLVNEAQRLIEKLISEDEDNGHKKNQQVIKMVEQAEYKDEDKAALKETFGEDQADAYLSYLASNSNSVINYLADYKISYQKKAEIFHNVLMEAVANLDKVEETQPTA